MIQVIDDFVIDSDSTQYVMGRLGKRLNKNKGAIEEFIRDPSYASHVYSFRDDFGDTLLRVVRSVFDSWCVLMHKEEYQ